MILPQDNEGLLQTYRKQRLGPDKLTLTIIESSQVVLGYKSRWVALPQGDALLLQTGHIQWLCLRILALTMIETSQIVLGF
jgi:hypothetical protein